jgi:putative peptidoglycan lipid II flippase
VKDAFGDITRFASRFSGATIVSRIVGLARDVVFAAWFGTGMAADAFNVAFLIPNLLRRVVGEGAAQAAVVPVYADTLEREGDREARVLGLKLAGVSIVVLVGVALLGVLLSSPIVRAYAFGWRDEPEKMALTIRLTRVLFPFVIFAGLTALAGAILNTRGRFTVPALAPAVLNLCFVGAAFALSPFFGSRPEDRIYGFALGALIGGLLGIVIQMPQMSRVGALGLPRVDFRDPRIRLVGRLMVPGFFGLAVTQINMFVDTFLATLLSEGSVTALRLANRLMLLPLGVFGIAIASASLPTLSGMAARRDFRELVKTYAFSFRLILFVLVPASIGLIVLRTPIVRLIYEHGAFTADRSTPMTAGALLFYSIGLFAYGGVKSSNQVFYALKDTRTPVVIGAVAMLVNVGLNLALMGPLGLNGLALATSLAAAANLVILMVLLHRRLGGLDGRVLLKSVSRILLAASIMGGVCVLVSWGLPRFIDQTRLVGQLVLVAGAVAAGLAVYWVVARALGIEELSVVAGVLGQRRSGGETGRRGDGEN